MQSDFVAAVSHEFRTPLSSVCHISEMLVDGRVADHERRDRLYGTLQRESERLRRLVEGLLDVARMDAGGRGTGSNGSSRPPFYRRWAASSRPMSSQPPTTPACRSTSRRISLSFVPIGRRLAAPSGTSWTMR